MKVQALFLVVLTMFFQLPVFHYANGDNSTLSQYCSSGTCTTGNHTLYYNTTQGFSSVGIYAGGIKLSHSELIGIQLSKTCMTLIKNNMSNNCLTYKQLAPLDNTNPVYAGQWTDRPYYHRLTPRVENFYNFQDTKYVVMVDPNPGFTTKARMIYVQDSDKIFSYDWGNTTGNNKIVYHYGRFVGGCETADVEPNMFIVNDTIHYLESGCTKTLFNDTSTYTRNGPSWDWNNPYSSMKWKWDGWAVNETGGKGISDCITHKCNFVDPYKNPDW